MKTQSQSKKFEGQCKFCSRDFSKRQIVEHLDVCEKRKSKKAETVQGLRLGIYDAYIKDFWLIVETDKTTKFEDLDKLIRDVWVECCGHMSSFGNYSAQIDKTRLIFETMRPGDNIPYVYDFGSSTELIVKALKYTNYGLAGGKHIELVARNYAPQTICTECGAEAKYNCTECGDDQMPFLCEKCVKNHDKDNGCYVLEIANSPRSGVCGYEPPAPLDKLF